MRVIIACAGSSAKWGNHLGVPRHLAPMAGEPLLHRTVRQALAVSDDVHVTSQDDGRYALPGVTHHVVTAPAPNELVSTQWLWARTGRTVLLLGDTFYTDEAIGTIAGFTPRRWQMFGRSGPSTLTGSPWGEIFGYSWWSQQAPMLLDNLKWVWFACHLGIAHRFLGWEVLRSIQGTPLNEHTVDPAWFTEINDLTDDLDFPRDYDRHPAATPEVMAHGAR